MGFKTYEKETTQNKHVNAKTKQTKNYDFWVMATHARTGLRTHEFSLRAQARSCKRRSLPKKT